MSNNIYRAHTSEISDKETPIRICKSAVLVPPLYMAINGTNDNDEWKLVV